MYGNPRSPVIEFRMTLTLDGNVTDILLNITNPASGIMLMYYADNMEVGDHQLSGRLAAIREQHIGIDYFECVVPLFRFIPRTVCH